VFNWYSYDRNLPNFYTLMSSTNEETFSKTALYFEKLLRHYNISIDYSVRTELNIIFVHD